MRSMILASNPHPLHPKRMSFTLFLIKFKTHFPTHTHDLNMQNKTNKNKEKKELISDSVLRSEIRTTLYLLKTHNEPKTKRRLSDNSKLFFTLMNETLNH